MSIDDATLRWCEDGHTWIDQGDGTVSPSWGLGGTHMQVDDARRCPEPRADELGEYWCDDRPGPPPPACLKPAVGANAWRDHDLPFDGHPWCAWWVRKDGAWRLTFHQGRNSHLWAAIYRCLDVHTGDWLDVDRTWDARRASLDEYPAYLRQRWWTTRNGTLIGCWSTMDKTGSAWLIEASQVETWVRQSVDLGVATDGLQLTFDVGA